MAEGGVELGAHGLERRQLDGKNFPGFGKVTHAGESVTGAGHFQPRFTGQEFQPAGLDGC
jgi:hypothetical protein